MNTITAIYKKLLYDYSRNKISWFILFILAVCIGITSTTEYYKLPFFAVGLGLAGIVGYYIITKPYWAFFIVIVMAFLAFLPGRLFSADIPVSSLVDLLIFILFFITFGLNKDSKDTSFLKQPISIGLFIFTLYYFVEFFNTEMYSIAGWLFTIRRIITFFFIYIIAYRLFDNFDKLKQFFNFWIILAVIACAYACFQQWYGLLPFEITYLNDHPVESALYFQGGQFRKFSFLSDPVVLGIMGGSISCFLLVFILNPTDPKKKKYHILFFLILLLGMSYSGTRTTNIMLPAAVAFYTLLTINNKKTVSVVISFMVIAAVIMFAPIDNPTLNRIRSTFQSKESSLELRDINRHYIQPYIYSHPFGGGIATSGEAGKKFNPGHVLAGFPPDSGLLQTAIEMGWIGFTLKMLFHLITLIQCIYSFFRMKFRQYKFYMLAITLSLFTMIITQYSQVTIGQFPNSFFYYISLALIIRLKQFDDAKSITV